MSREPEGSLHHTDWVFALTVLDNAVKHRKLKRAHPLVKRVEKILIEAGFVVEGDEWLILRSTELCVNSTVRERVQKKADESLDPELISFSQVADVLKRNGTLPGIRNDIDDSPLGDNLSVDECHPPPKPWETTISISQIMHTMLVENMSSELTRSLFRLTRPSFAEFVHSGTPFFSGADKRMINFEPVVHYLNRGSSVQLSDRNWRTVTNDAEDFGVDELSSAARLK